MKRGLWIVLVLSLALNVGFATAVVVHWADVHRLGGSERIAGAYPGRGLAPGTTPLGPQPVAGYAERGRPGPGDRALARPRRGDRSWRERCGWIRSGGSGPHLPPPGFLRDWPNRRIARLRVALGLSPEQAERLRSSLVELREEIRSSTVELMREREAMRWALREGKAAPEDIRKRARHVGELQARVDSLVAEAFLRENAVLRPEQRDRYRDLEWGPGDAGSPPSAPPNERP